MTLKITQKYVKSFDGTKIGYQVTGKGQKCFVLCNGLGGRVSAWSPLIEEFYNEYRFITWDYRGIFTSEVPEDLNSLAIPCHVKDLQAILKKEKIKSGIVAGWSMGVQVALEFYRVQAQFFKAIFLINGAPGVPLKTALNSPLSRYLVPVVNGLLKKAIPKVKDQVLPLAKTVVNQQEFLSIVAKLGLIHKNLNSKIFKEIAHDILDTNLVVYHEILDHLARHDATDVLEHIKVPVLLISGQRDLMTPSHVAEKMALQIPDAELMVINESSHYSLIEFPELINARLSQFFYEHEL